MVLFLCRYTQQLFDQIFVPNNVAVAMRLNVYNFNKVNVMFAFSVVKMQHLDLCH